MTNITYIVCFFLGERRNALAEQDPLVLVNKHIEFLSSLPKNSKIKKAIFVVNCDNTDYPDKIRDTLFNLCKQRMKNIPIEILIRDNVDFSYGAWNDAVAGEIQNKNNADYYFLIEDDYLPTTKDFYNAYLTFMKNKVKYVASYVNYAQEADYEHLKRLALEEQVHKFIPSISNGLLDGKIAIQMFEKYGTVFKIWAATNYDYAVTNQLTFLNHIINNGYEIDDICSEYSVPFLAIPWYGNPDGIIVYGNKKKPVIIAPIHERYNNDSIIQS